MKRIVLGLVLLFAATQAQAQTAIGATCQAQPIICDINATLPGKVVVASSSPSTDCASQTVIVTVNSSSKTLSYGTDFTGGTKLATCNSLAAAILPLAGIKNATCAADGATVYVYPFRDQVQYWNMVSSSGTCATTTLPQAGKVQIGSTFLVNNGNGVLALTKLDGTTSAALTTGATTQGAETLTPSAAVALTITGAAGQNGIAYTGTAPASVATNGTAAGVGVTWTGAAGGATSGVTSQTAGAGEGWSVTLGTGGSAPSGSTNGAGGSFTVIPGAAGGGAGSAGTGGAVVLKAPAASYGTVLSVQQSTGTANFTVSDAGAVTAAALVTASGGLSTPSTIDTGTGSTLTTATSGGLFVSNASTDAVTTWVLPAASTKANYCFSQGASSLGSNREVDVATPSGSDLIIATTTAAGGTGIATTAGASHGVKNTHATAVRGNMMCLQADGVNTWYETAISGTWAAF